MPLVKRARLEKSIDHMHPRTPILVLLSFLSASALAGCSMKEEMRRIEETNRVRAFADASRSTNLSGEQIFLRSCNTCHIGGGQGAQAPTLIDMDKNFPSDDALKAFLRKGKKTMPPLPVSSINDQELNNLVVYLRQLNIDLHDDEVAAQEREIRQAKQKEEREKQKALQKEKEHQARLERRANAKKHH